MYLICVCFVCVILLLIILFHTTYSLVTFEIVKKKLELNGSQLFFLAGHKGSKPVQRLMSEGQMTTIVLCISMYIGVDKGPNRYGLRAGFGPRAAI